MANDRPTPHATTQAEQASWEFQNSYIERLMDNSALTAAHPDDTLILAGPPRHLAQPSNALFFRKLLPLGMIQNMQVTQQKPTTPMQAIGSGRLFFISGKAQGQASIARLFVNGRNLLRALYTNAIQAGVDVSKFDDAAAQGSLNQFFANLDSELFMIPFGMAVFFRDKIHNEIGAFYLELCMINSWAIGVGAGQNMIMENVNMMFDRLKPISSGTVGAREDSPNYKPSSPDTGALIKTVFQNDPTTTNPGGAGDDVDRINNNT